MILIRLQLAGCKQKVLGQVPIVVGSVGGSLILAMADEKDVRTRIDQDLSEVLEGRGRRIGQGMRTQAHVCSIFDAGIELYPADICRSTQLTNSDGLPISAGEVGIGGASGWRVVQQLLQLSLGQ